LSPTRGPALTARTDAILELVAEVVTVVDADGVIRYESPALEPMLGWTPEDLVGRTAFEFVHADDLERVLAVFGAALENPGEVYRVDLRFRRKDGRFADLDILGRNLLDDPVVAGILLTCRDATERRAAERERAELGRQLRQAQKMEALGTLAGGIAHDFNNLLTAVLGFADIARRETSAERRTAMLDRVVQAGSRAKELVGRILAVSRVSEQEMRPVRLQDTVREAAALLRGSIPPDVEIDVRVDEASGPVFADPSRIHQVLMNLGTNAWHAVRDRGPGDPPRISVGLEPATISEARARKLLLDRGGSYVRLSVADNGSGIDERLVERIFDPYFTTKAQGEGTGLGLAIVHSVVAAHDGAIGVASRVGEGTVFDIFLPVVVVEPRPVADGAIDAPAIGGTERVLLVDDEPMIADLGAEILEGLGYRVRTFTSPAEALAAFLAAPGEFDAMITDVAMPGKTGVDLAHDVLAARPDLPIVLCTGYSERETSEKAAAIGLTEFVAKPYTIEALAAALRRAIDHARAD
jgi:PAS domain S-box-containing protein